jgi:hypothetical protein
MPPAVTPPAQTPADQPAAPDLTSIIDAISGLVGAIGSGSGSSGAGGGSSGSAGGSDDGSSESSAAETQPAAPMDPVTKRSAAPADSDAAAEMDIALTSIRMVDAGNLELKTGPRYRLFYVNKGTVEVPRFQVTVAVDSGMQLTDAAEIVTVEAQGLKPGKSQSVDVRLPVEVLKMTMGKDGRPVPFMLLAAIVDSDEDLTETDEENNVLALARDDIKPIEKGGLAGK